MNGVMLQAFEWHLSGDGGHWRKLAKMSPALRRLGFTAIWLPPATKGAGGAGDVGYGVYDLYDLGEFDQKGSVRTKYGTVQEYILAVKALRACGIQVLADAVLNHRLGADETERTAAHAVDPENRNVRLTEDKPAETYTRFTFPGRKGRYSDFEWNASCFTGVDWNGLDHDHHLFQFAGKSWAKDVDGEHGSFDYLMGADVDTQSREVRQELVRWGTWYVWKTGVDGFRLDAVKHISADFYDEWLRRLRVMTGQELFAVGEYWHHRVEELHRYIDATHEQMNLFDVPLHHRFCRLSHGDGSVDFARLFDDTLVGTRPHMAVTFVDNHDTQPGQSLESWVQDWFKPTAYGLILLRSFGYPCVFWGDLYGIPSQGIAPAAHLTELLRLRRMNAWGEERDYFDHPDRIGFTREGDLSHPGSGLAFVCSVRAGGEKRMLVGRRFAGRRFRCVIGDQPDAVIDSEGFGTFAVNDGSMSVYVPVISPLTQLMQRIRALLR